MVRGSHRKSGGDCCESSHRVGGNPRLCEPIGGECLLSFGGGGAERLLAVSGLAEGIFGSGDGGVGELSAESLKAVDMVDILEPQAVAVAKAVLMGEADGRVDFSGVASRGWPRRQRTPVEGRSGESIRT